MDLAAQLDAILADFNEIVDTSLSNTMLVDRLEGTGRLTTKTATDHGVLGYVARASNIDFAMLKNIVPDFPLCNKSFNPSYSGNDL